MDLDETCRRSRDTNQPGVRYRRNYARIARRGALSNDHSVRRALVRLGSEVCMPLRSARQAVGLPETDYRIKSVNGTDVTDRTSIIQEVNKVAIGEPIIFFLERSGEYSHNPLRGKNARYHKQWFTPSDEFPLT